MRIRLKFPHRLFVLLLVGTLVALAGCQKKTFYEIVDQNPHLGMPGTLDHLISMDMARLRKRDGYSQFQKELREAPEVGTFLETLRERLGFDLLKDIDRVILGAQGRADPENPAKNMVFLIKGRLGDPATMMDGLHQWVGEEYLIAPPKFRQLTHPGTNYKKYQTSAQSMYNENLMVELNFGFPTAPDPGEAPSAALSTRMMAFSYNSALLGSTMDVISGQAEGIQKSETWVQMLDRPDIGTIFWGTGNMANVGLEDLGEMADGLKNLRKATQYYFDFNMSDEVTAELGLVCQSIEDAETLAKDIKNGLKGLKELMGFVALMAPETAKLPDRIIAIAKQEITRVILSMSQEQRQALVNEWKALSRQAESGGLPLPGLGGQPGMMMPGQPGMPEGMIPGQPAAPTPQEAPTQP